MMNIRKLTSAVAIAALCASGGAFASSHTNTSGPSTSPSNTPNDSTATPPNTAVPAGTPAPAPSAPAATSPTSTTPVTPVNPKEGRGKAPSDMGNTNVSPTQGGAAPYTTPPTGK